MTELYPINHSSVEALSDGRLRITIPQTLSGWIFIFLLIWTPLWIYGGSQGIRPYWKAPISAKDPFDLLFSLFVTGMWIAGSIYGVLAWLWNLGGVETVIVDSEKITQRQAMLGLSLTRTFLVDKISNLRFLPTERRGRRRIESGIAFDLNNKTKRIARNLEQLEAERLLEQVRHTVGIRRRT